MARVNIEDRIFCESRLNKLAKKMGWDEPKALGVLTYIWHDSQELLQVECSAEDIVTYARVVDESDGEKLISALKSARFVSSSESGLLKIHGNDVQIERRVSMLKKSVKGAESTKKRWEEYKNQNASSIAPTAPAGPLQPGAIQTRPDQTRPDQCISPSGEAGDEIVEAPKRAKKERATSWDDKDPFAKIFANLLACSAYAAIFDREKERKTIQGHMDRHSLSAEDMERVSWDFRNWSDGPVKIVSPRGTLATFVATFVRKTEEDRAKKVSAPAPRKYPILNRPKAGDERAS